MLAAGGVIPRHGGVVGTDDEYEFGLWPIAGVIRYPAVVFCVGSLGVSVSCVDVDGVGIVVGAGLLVQAVKQRVQAGGGVDVLAVVAGVVDVLPHDEHYSVPFPAAWPR